MFFCLFCFAQVHFICFFQETASIDSPMIAATHQIKAEEVVTNSSLNGLDCSLHGGMLAIIFLLFNIMANISKQISTEWTAATIAGAIFLPNTSGKCCNQTTLCLLWACIWSLWACIWSLQVVIRLSISTQPVILCTVLHEMLTGIMQVKQCTIKHILEPEEVVTHVSLNALRCIVRGGMLAIIFLLLNMMIDIPMLMSTEWTAATIAGAILLPDIRRRYYNKTTMCLFLACIWSLQVVIGLSISTNPIIVSTVLYGMVTGIMKATQLTIKHIMKPKYCLEAHAVKQFLKPRRNGGKKKKRKQRKNNMQRYLAEAANIGEILQSSSQTGCFPDDILEMYKQCLSWIQLFPKLSLSSALKYSMSFCLYYQDKILLTAAWKMVQTKLIAEDLLDAWYSPTCDSRVWCRRIERLVCVIGKKCQASFEGCIAKLCQFNLYMNCSFVCCTARICQSNVHMYCRWWLTFSISFTFSTMQLGFKTLMLIAVLLCKMLQIQFPGMSVIHLIVMHCVWKLQSQSLELELGIRLIGLLTFIATFLYEGLTIDIRCTTVSQEAALLIQPVVSGVCCSLIAMLAIGSTTMIAHHYLQRRICHNKAVFLKNNRFSKLKAIVHSQYVKRVLSRLLFLMTMSVTVSGMDTAPGIGRCNIAENRPGTQRLSNAGPVLLSGQGQSLNDMHSVILDSPSGTPSLSYGETRPITDMPQPRSLESLFQQCSDNPSFIPTGRDALRIANGVRRRMFQSRRRQDREQEQRTAIDRLNMSFNSAQVPNPHDLEQVSEQDPDAAILLLHETAGLWRFDPRINGGSINSIIQELEQEECTPQRIDSLISIFEQRLSILQDIKACGCCGKRQLISEEKMQFTAVNIQDERLNILQLTDESIQNYELAGEYRQAMSVWPGTNTGSVTSVRGAQYWLHPELVDTVVNNDEEQEHYYTLLCHECLSDLNAKKIPENSIAAGIDFGNPDRLNLPALTLVELYLISPIRIYGSVIKLKAFQKDEDVRVLNGHLIAFQHFNRAALDEIRQQQYPRLNEVSELVSVSFLGDQGQLDKMLNGGDHRMPNELKVRPHVIYEWLAALSVLNPVLFPAGSIIERTVDLEHQLQALPRQLLRNGQLIDRVGQQMDDIIQSDIARVRDSTQQVADDIDIEFMGNRSDEACTPRMPAVLLRGNTEAAPETGNSDMQTAAILNEARNLIQPDSGHQNSSTSAMPFRINRESEAINEFSQNNTLFLGGFPTLFFLGKGITCTGSIPQKVAEHMLLQFHGHFAKNRWFLFALMNQHMRHSAACSVNAAVNAHPDSIEEFNGIIREQSFRDRVIRCCDNPNTSEARDLANKCRTFVQMAGAKVPYSPAERNEGLTKMYSMTYRYGMATTFLTLAPDDTGSPLVIRLALPFEGNKTFPSVGNMYGDDIDGLFRAIEQGDVSFHDIPIANSARNKQLNKLVAEDPVAAALVFKRVIEIVMEVMLGIKPDYMVRSTIPLQNRPKGIFGTTTAVFAVVETQARKTLHGHAAIWGSIPPGFLQSMATNEVVVQKVSDVLDSFYTARLPPVVHVKGLLNRVHKIRPARASRMKPISPGIVGFDTFMASCAVKVDRIGGQMHKHTFTCRKGKNGLLACRLARPAGLNPKTGPKQIEFATGSDEEEAGNRTNIAKWKVLDSVQPEENSNRRFRNRATHPLPESDPRCIVWELMREEIDAEAVIQGLAPDIKNEIDLLNDQTKGLLMKALAVRNGAVVEFSPALTECLGCNTAAYLLGSEEQARSALFYLVKYMMKDSVALGNSLPVIRQAMKHVNSYESHATDAGSDSRTNKFFMQRIVNGFTGLAEISDTQCAACLLGMRSMVSTEAHWFSFIKTAVAFQLQQQIEFQENGCNPNNAWGDDSDFEDHPPDSMSDHGQDDDILENMDSWAGLGGDDDTSDTRGKGRFGKMQIFKIGNECIPVGQHTHYMFRGEALERMNYYEWCSIIKVIPKKIDNQVPEHSHTGGWQEMSQGARGRRKNGTFEFAEGHPLRGHYVQMIRSKLLCPILAGGPPPTYPNPPTGLRSARWKRKADAFARYHLTLFRPWDISTGLAWDHNQSAWDEFCTFMNELDPHPHDERTPSFVDICRFHTICNVASALRVNIKRKKLLTMHRCRDARVWKARTPDYACEFETLIHGEVETLYDFRSRPGEEAAEAASEIERLLRLNGSDGADNSNRAAGYAFVQSSVSFLDQMFGQASIAPANQADIDSMILGADAAGLPVDIAAARAVLEAAVNHDHDTTRDRSQNGNRPGFCSTTLNSELQSSIDMMDSNALQISKQILESGHVLGAVEQLINAGLTMSDINILSNHWQLQAAIRYINEQLVRPNAEQRVLLDRLIERVMRRSAYGNHHQNIERVPAEHLLVLGGPGVGKTHFVKRLILELEGMGHSLVSVAFTGVAACNIPGGRTIHSVFGIPMKASESRKLAPLGAEQAYVLKVFVQNCSFLLIDEISMVSPALLGMMHERLQQAMDNNLPFGGLEVIALGDFYQLQPCNPPAMFTAIMDMVQGGGAERTGPINSTGYRQVGAGLFKTFKLIELKQQMRAREDTIHSAWVEKFRDPSCRQPVDDEFIALLHSRALSEQDVIDDPSWAWAPIAIAGNMEKRELDWRQAKAFAAAHGVPLVVWNNTITKPESLAHSGRAQLNNLYAQEIGLRSFFVKGSPAYLSQNWRKGGVSRGLANGTSCTMHSLTFRMETHEQRHTAHEKLLQIQNASPGEIVDLGSVVPLSINVIHSVTASEARNWPANGSLVPPEIDESNSTGTVVVPVLCDSSDDIRTRSCGNFWAGGQVKFKCHSLEPAFAITYHKLQGKTVSKIILDLRKRPGICIKDVTFEGLYVGWTRVRKGADIRVIPCGNRGTFDHLKKLGPSSKLIAWMSGFGQPEQTTGQVRGWSAESAMGQWRVLNNDLGEARQGGNRGRARQGGGDSANYDNLDLQTVLSMDRQCLMQMQRPALLAIQRNLQVRGARNLRKDGLIDCIMAFIHSYHNDNGNQNMQNSDVHTSVNRSVQPGEQSGHENMPTEVSRQQRAADGPRQGHRCNAGPNLARQPAGANRRLGAAHAAAHIGAGECQMPPARIFAISHTVDNLTYICMGTLSWFWVPVIAHATGIRGYPRLPSDQHLFNNGALFSLCGLVGIVHHLVVTGRFTLSATDWNWMEGNMFYVSAEAQDRLMNLLMTTHVVGPNISNVMQQVIWWFDSLWADQVLRLSVRHNMNASPAMAAVIAPHWRRDGNGQPLPVPSSGGLNPVWI
jgi:hypothetical protein